MRHANVLKTMVALGLVMALMCTDAAAKRIVKYKGSSRPVAVNESVLAMSAIANTEIEYSEPDYKAKIDSYTLPNDVPYATTDWRIYDFSRAWSRVTSSSNSVKIAIIDTGIITNHMDLDESIMRLQESKTYLDDNGHGTEVFGIIAAIGNNHFGMVGLDWNVNLEVHVYKFMDSTGSGDISDAIDAIYQAVDDGVQVINCSWGMTDYSLGLRDAMAYAKEHNVLVICSAGNDGANNDSYPHYPSNYNQELDNVISVGASEDAYLAWFSDYGYTVDCVAPGVDILTTTNDGGYMIGSGTSFSAPYVTALVAMVISQNPTMTYSEVKNRILTTTIGSEDSYINMSGGIISAYNAITNSSTHDVDEIPAPSNNNENSTNENTTVTADGGSGGGGCFISTAR